MPTNISQSLSRFTVSLCLLSGCAQSHMWGRIPERHPSPAAVSIPSDNGVSALSGLDFAKTWDRTLNTLYFKGYPLKSADKDSGMIVTDKKVMLLSDSDADCPEFRGFPYIEKKRTIKYISQTIKIGNGKKSTIHVVSNIDGAPSDDLTSAEKGLSCISRGVLERELVAEIISPMNPPPLH